MSNSTAGILEAYQVAQTYDYTSVALLSLVAYEFITTVDQEVACVWTRRPSATSVLLVTTRWVMVLYQALQWIPYHTYSACWALEVTDFTLYLVSLAQMAVFSSLRVYALWSRSQLRYLFAVAVLALSCVPIATNIFQLSRIYAVWSGPPIDTCNIVSNISNHLNRSASADPQLRAVRGRARPGADLDRDVPPLAAAAPAQHGRVGVGAAPT
ncbi:hypothetical protein PsYK624_145550 [Phanerochaete sordida]|uniref:DUF6533 domain-containing protein n=1 Tax=Phanerochaete sordida TaxID=48140 RepID=A0A9P3GMU8_9APHY|nr:hypothetical protein PsYK624_145550 [Phanerochaete sordida]